MKQTQLYYALMLFFLVLCSCEDDIPLFPEENEFMSLSSKSSITLDENILQIQATVQKVDSAIPFFNRFKELYGNPLWQYAIPMGEEDERDISFFVPIYKDNTKRIINTIWFFDLVGDTLRYKTITRDNDSICYYQQDFVFDELSCNIFGDESTAKIKFEASPQTRSWVKEYYDCHYGIIQWGEVEVHKELYCKERFVWKQETVTGVTDNNPIIGGETPIGGGGGTPSPSPDEEKKLTSNNLMTSVAEIKKMMKELGCDIDDVTIELGIECGSNARVSVDEKNGAKTIEICNKFFDYEYKDQISILYHEAYHCTHDRPWSNKERMSLDPPLIIEIPEVHMNYLRDYVYDLILPNEKQGYIDSWDKKIEYLNCPEYYENEINAYKSERITMPNVSAKYNQEREYMFWKNSILGNKSSTMYNHQK